MQVKKKIKQKQTRDIYCTIGTNYRYCYILILKVYLRCVTIRIIPYSTKVCRSGCFHIRLLNDYFKKRYVKPFFVSLFSRDIDIEYKKGILIAKIEIIHISCTIQHRCKNEACSEVFRYYLNVKFKTFHLLINCQSKLHRMLNNVHFRDTLKYFQSLNTESWK